jgi:sigma-B regulation protein RsbU (phosphoserine phosphatase)
MFDRMRGLPIFAGFPDADLERLAVSGAQRRLRAGEVLFRQGAEGHECYVILAGELEVIGHPGDEEVRLEVRRAGQIIGEMALIDPSPRSATVRALTHSDVVVLNEQEFTTLMHSNPALTLDLLRGNTIRLRRTSQQMIDDMTAKNAALSRAYNELLEAQAEHIRLSRLEEELSVARRIQQLFLPRKLPQPAGWQVAAFNRGAQEVGGDFFDCIELPGGHLGVIVADVCGKGVPAALFVALTRSLVRASSTAPWVFQRGDTAAMDQLLAGALWFTNDYIASEHGESNMFITLFYGVLNPKTGQIHYINAGHNPPLLVGAGGGTIRELENSGLPLGIVGGQIFDAYEITLAPGECLVAFSDGITEAMSPSGEPYGDDRLLAALRANTGANAHALVDALVQAVDTYAAGAAQADDMTILIVNRTT